jgi:hypothetical protein
LSQARPTNPKAKIPWKKPRGIHSVSPADINLDSLTEGWKIDRSVEHVSNWRGGSAEARVFSKISSATKSNATHSTGKKFDSKKYIAQNAQVGLFE